MGPRASDHKHTFREPAFVPPTAARKSADTPGTREVEPALISMATAAAVVGAVSSKRLDLRLLVVAVVCISHSDSQLYCSSGRFETHAGQPHVPYNRLLLKMPHLPNPEANSRWLDD